MPMNIIEQAQHSKSGKTLRLSLGGRWYSTPEFKWQDHVNQMVRYEVGTSEYNGKTIYFANNIELVGNGGTAPPPQTQSPPPMGSPQQTQQQFNPRDYLPMTSNLVAHAIAAGHCQTPESINAWALAAFHAAKKLIEGPQAPGGSDDFDDDIPF